MGKMTQEPLYLEGHPKRVEQDSQRVNTDAPSPNKKKRKKKNIGLCIQLVNLGKEKPPEDNNVVYIH